MRPYHAGELPWPPLVPRPRFLTPSQTCSVYMGASKGSVEGNDQHDHMMILGADEECRQQMSVKQRQIQRSDVSPGHCDSTPSPLEARRSIEKPPAERSSCSAPAVMVSSAPACPIFPVTITPSLQPPPRLRLSSTTYLVAVGRISQRRTWCSCSYSRTIFWLSDKPRLGSE